MTEAEVALKLAAGAASLSGGLALLLWRQGLIPEGSADEFATKLQQIAQDFEDAGADGPASQLWTAANLLRRSSPRGPESSPDRP